MKDMDASEREYLAREILNNQLFKAILEKMEREAINRAVSAPLTDSLAQQAALAEIRASRTFRQNCEAQLLNNLPVKAAPA